MKYVKVKIDKEEVKIEPEYGSTLRSTDAAALSTLRAETNEALVARSSFK